MSLHLFHSSVIWIQLTHHAIRRGDMNQLQLFPDGSNMHSWYLEVLSCFSLCWKVEIWILLWSISFLCYVLHICKGTWGKSWGRFFYTEKLSILSININGYLLLSQQPILEILLAFIIFQGGGEWLGKWFFSICKFYI